MSWSSRNRPASAAAVRAHRQLRRTAAGRGQGRLALGEFAKQRLLRRSADRGRAHLRLRVGEPRPLRRIAAEEVGADGPYFRVHHLARQLASPFPLLAAAGARTSRVELGTGVIDMRYENPLYMAEDAGTADLIAGGRLQLGISRGSPS
ncbi:MAG: LLM class flavin-dependent oxidoreductase [Nocardioidaceae bacterium]